MDSKIVTIDLDLRSYDIYIGSRLLHRIMEFIPESVESRAVFIISDESVENYAQSVESALRDGGARSVETYQIKPGEAAKSFTNVENITNWLLDNNINRNSLIFAVGGGVVGDLTGFCASIVLRGVPYIQIPTTLLAQVDSSVGGKTGINTSQGKNLIGSFYQPGSVVMDVETLKTLPKRQLLAGYAEIVKYGLINDSGFFNWLEQNGESVCNLDYEDLIHAIEASVKAKAAIVERDEKEEQGQRALLNLGHTFGHALEAVAGYDGSLLHGEAVAIGIVMAFELSCRMDLCEREDVERVEQHFSKIGLPIYASMVNPVLVTTIDNILEIMRQDKKAVSGVMNLILVNGIGEAFMSDEAPESLIRNVIKDSLGADIQDTQNIKGSTANEFKRKGVKGLWRSAFSSRS